MPSPGGQRVTTSSPFVKAIGAVAGNEAWHYCLLQGDGDTVTGR
jgi:hypothetical protein